GHGRVNGPAVAVRRHQGQALRAAARPDHDAPAVRWGGRYGRGHRDPGRADALHQEDVPGAGCLPHRADHGADRGRLRPGPVVHRPGGPGVRLHRPGHHPRATGAVRRRRQRVRRGSLMTELISRGLRVENRYVLPSFVERTSYGIKESNPYNKLFEERIIFLGVQIDDASANDVMAQLLTLESSDPDREITMYINSPGGSYTAMTAIYDTMQFVRPDIVTVCLGQAASAAAVLLSAGTPGKRMALPHSRIIIHQPAMEGGYGQGSDIEIQAREIMRMRTQLEEMIARHSGQPVSKVTKDIDRDKIMTAEEAKEYGL